MLVVLLRTAVTPHSLRLVECACVVIRFDDPHHELARAARATERSGGLKQHAADPFAVSAGRDVNVVDLPFESTHHLYACWAARHKADEPCGVFGEDEVFAIRDTAAPPLGPSLCGLPREKRGRELRSVSHTPARELKLGDTGRVGVTTGAEARIHGCEVGVHLNTYWSSKNGQRGPTS